MTRAYRQCTDMLRSQGKFRCFHDLLLRLRCTHRTSDDPAFFRDKDCILADGEASALEIIERDIDDIVEKLATQILAE